MRRPANERPPSPRLTRRRFLKSAAQIGMSASLARFVPGYASAVAMGDLPSFSGIVTDADLRIERRAVQIGPLTGDALTINGSMPGPLLRFREGDSVTLRVSNALDEDTSIHWHGLIVPTDMDGVPGVSFPGIRPGESFTYRFRLQQSGTYWYHSHSGLQEQSGVFGPMVVEPSRGESFAYERDYVVMLSDWTFEDPYEILAKLKKQAGYFNNQRRTLGDLVRDTETQGWRATLAERREWAAMRMDPTDIADVTGRAYTYLMNGLPASGNWTGLFQPGERVRLRFINAAAGTYFDVRIPGLPMTVVQADGQNVEPVTVDELRMAIAETYDVIVQPPEERAFTVFAESADRSGYARGTLTPRLGMSAPIPARRPRPLRTMADMGMAGHAVGTGNHRAPEEGAQDTMVGMETARPAEGVAHRGHEGMAQAPEVYPHGPDHHGPGNAAVAQVARSRVHEPGTGLGGDGWRVLVYADLRSLDPRGDDRTPHRDVELHLTGNMDRYMWSFDGKTYAEALAPIPFTLGERLRLVLVNDTMMEHPIHLHGMWMELDNGAGERRPLKHTVNVKPAERMHLFVTPDVPGPWALHCHILYHMELGMFRVVDVRAGHEGHA